MLRTYEEIIEKHKSLGREGDPFGFCTEVLLSYLPAGLLLPLCRVGADLSDWAPRPLDEASILEEMREYMAFAWGKVEDHRGISANRSVDKMEEWLWILGREDLLETVEAALYQNYGAPKLKIICEALGFPLSTDSRALRMMEGLSCGDHMGCGCSG